MNARADRLVQDLHKVASDAEGLLSEVAGSTAQGIGAVRERLGLKLKDARAALERTQGAVTDRAKQAANVTHGYVVEHPWQSLAVAAAAGVVVGVLVTRH